MNNFSKCISKIPGRDNKTSKADTICLYTLLGSLMRKVGLLFVMLWLFTACAGNRAETNVDLRISDYHFAPNSITVPAGQEITLHVNNEGFVSHQFAIFKLGTSPGEKFDNEDKENLYWLFEIKPGHEGAAIFTAPSEPGEYYFICGIFGHLEAGMFGNLTVVENK